VFARRLALASALCILAAAVVHVLAVRTGWGQGADNAAFEGRLTASIEARRDADQVLRLITMPSLALLGAAVILVAWWRGHWRLGLAGGTVIAGAVLTSEALKRLLERPDLTDDPIAFNSWPSGHVTIATSVSLAVVMVAPLAVRLPTAISGCAFTATFGAAVILSGWHRPADSMGGYLIALAWAFGVTAVLVAWRGSGTEEHDFARRSRITSLVVAMVALGAFGALAVIVLISRGAELTNVESSEALFVALAQVAVLGVLAVGSYGFMIGHSVLDPPGREAEHNVQVEGATAPGT